MKGRLIKSGRPPSVALLSKRLSFIFAQALGGGGGAFVGEWHNFPFNKWSSDQHTSGFPVGFTTGNDSISLSTKRNLKSADGGKSPSTNGCPQQYWYKSST